MRGVKRKDVRPKWGRRMPGSTVLFAVTSCVLFPGRPAISAGHPSETLDRRAAVQALVALDSAHPRSKEAVRRFEVAHPIVFDWLLQDGKDTVLQRLSGQPGPLVTTAMIERAVHELGEAGAPLRKRFVALAGSDAEGADPRWVELYLTACERRRAVRLRPLMDRWRRIVFTKHYNLGGSHYAYTEGQSDAQRERHFKPGASLCILELSGITGTVRTLIDDPNGVIRDPAVSHDGKRILFAWKKSDRQDDYHLYEMTVADGRLRQLTSGLGFADYEPAYLPDGGIVFTSTRCVQTVDCWWTEVSNLYTCDAEGKHLRRLGFDQVHTNFPTVLEDGRVIYTRWEYSDRGQVFVQGLFQMNPDGTGQTAFYGNNSWFPTTLLHARGIPGTRQVVAVASGHHTRQTGKLVIVDPARGHEEAAGVRLIAPVRRTEAVRVDRYGQDGELFQYPYPLSETQFLVTYDPFGYEREPLLFKIYLMTIDGRRELLVADESISCNQPVPLVPRPFPHRRPDVADHRKATGVYFVQDVYQGQGLRGVPRGAIKKLRVVAVEYRAAGVGSNRNRGPAGAALISTPIAVNNGAWDVKIVLGDATVHEDGSACFRVPARTPVYFQALNANGHAVQTMRSWSTLQPGEYFSCVGCHETKSTVPPPVDRAPTAMRTGPQELEPFYGPARGFSFPREIQPVLDRHCVRCHRERGPEVVRQARPSASHHNSNDPVEALNDGRQPAGSNDKTIPRFTWWPHKGTREWVQYDLPEPRRVKGVRVFWFDDRRSGGRCRVPASCRVLLRVGDAWTEVSDERHCGLDVDRENAVSFKPMRTTAIRLLVRLRPGYSGGILEWGVDSSEVKREQGAPHPIAFSLRGVETVDPRAKRRWSDAYLALTRRGQPNRIVNWISAQSIPSVLPPYHAGAAKSRLIWMLRKGHHGVTLSKEEMDKIACWIDLLVPYCGDYTEASAWTERERATYAHFAAKRRRMAVEERESIQALLAE